MSGKEQDWSREEAHRDLTGSDGIKMPLASPPAPLETLHSATDNLLVNGFPELSVNTERNAPRIEMGHALF